MYDDPGRRGETKMVVFFTSRLTLNPFTAGISTVEFLAVSVFWFWFCACFHWCTVFWSKFASTIQQVVFRLCANKPVNQAGTDGDGDVSVLGTVRMRAFRYFLLCFVSLPLVCVLMFVLDT